MYENTHWHSTQAMIYLFSNIVIELHELRLDHLQVMSCVLFYDTVHKPAYTNAP